MVVTTFKVPAFMLVMYTGLVPDTKHDDDEDDHLLEAELRRCERLVAEGDVPETVFVDVRLEDLLAVDIEEEHFKVKFTVHVSWFDKEYMNETSDANRGQDPNPGKEVTSFCAPMIKIKNADEANGDDGWYMHNGKAKGVIGGVVVSKAGYIQSIRGLVTAKVTLTCTLEKESDRQEHKPLFFSQQYPFDYAELPVSSFLEDNADDLIENDANVRRLFASKRQVSVVSNTDLSPDM